MTSKGGLLVSISIVERFYYRKCIENVLKIFSKQFHTEHRPLYGQGIVLSLTLIVSSALNLLTAENMQLNVKHPLYIHYQ